MVRAQHRIAFTIVVLTGGAGITNAEEDAKVQRGTLMYQTSHSQEVAKLGNDLLTQTRVLFSNHT